MRRLNDEHIRWAAQAVTSYAPTYSGPEGLEDVVRLANADPRSFFARLLAVWDASYFSRLFKACFGVSSAPARPRAELASASAPCWRRSCRL
jgi:hypothetical protein